MLRRTLLAFAATGLVAGAAGYAHAQVQLRAMSAFPAAFPQTKSFQEYVKRLNDALKGKVAVQYVGGPEAIPIAQQGNAIKNGVIDLLYSAPTLNSGLFPEAEAFAGSHLTPAKRRELGGTEILDQAVAKRLNAKFLMNIDGGEQLHIYLVKEPKKNADGSLDLKGLKLRSSELYVPFYNALGITPVVMPPGEIYTALERGTVDGIGWSVAGVRQGGWTKLLKFWIEPPMYWTSTYVIMSRPKWDAMPKDVQDEVMKITIAYENESFDLFAKGVLEEKAEFAKSGMKPITLEGAAAKAYVDLAHNSLWEKITKITPFDFDRAEILRKYYGR